MKLREKINYMAMPGLKPGLKFFGSFGKTIASIIYLVELEFGVSYQRMKSVHRYREIVTARTVAIFLIKNHTDKSLKEIGQMFGGRDHTTAIHSIRSVQAHIEAEPSFKRTILKLENELLVN